MHLTSEYAHPDTQQHLGTASIQYQWTASIVKHRVLRCHKSSQTVSLTSRRTSVSVDADAAGPTNTTVLKPKPEVEREATPLPVPGEENVKLEYVVPTIRIRC
ncbi:hypothetical protein EXIGLDRAFT_730549 [Exidia glandulosa HHB12029]|uniref:Uncharacterized protein n=1 Tax=Exidia glandulosa HHB12029 TaxID=1314781 RepID=A0A165C4P3_EXIGL|nr:hypothetical protein EXIGLDRAFT_730549 [Exidia glandulosa HHB12029]